MLIATLVGGISLGFLYGLVALTLILLVRTTGVLNFAAADLGMLCAFIAFAAITQFHLPALAAVAVTLLFSGVLGVVVYCGIVLIRPADPLTLSLRTLGLLLIVNGIAFKVWGPNSPYTFPRVPAGRLLLDFRTQSRLHPASRDLFRDSCVAFSLVADRAHTDRPIAPRRQRRSRDRRRSRSFCCRR